MKCIKDPSMQCEGPIPEECADPFMVEEREMMNLLSAIWNIFQHVEKHHPDEETEFRYAIHNLQRMISVRMTSKILAGWNRKEVSNEGNSCEETQETSKK